jgi:hypothetical protein
MDLKTKTGGAQQIQVPFRMGFRRRADQARTNSEDKKWACPYCEERHAQDPGAEPSTRYSSWTTLLRHIQTSTAASDGVHHEEMKVFHKTYTHSSRVNTKLTSISTDPRRMGT